MLLGELIDDEQQCGCVIRRLRFALHIKQHDDEHDEYEDEVPAFLNT